MQLTAKQDALIDCLLKHDNVLAYGGARSGKTSGVIYYAIFCATNFPGARILITRRYATDVRSSIWSETIPKVLALLDMHSGEDFKYNEQYMELSFPNGSVLLCAGLDDKERVDKILGTEYCMIYINESQDVPWPTVKTIRTRLAQRLPGMRNRFIADLNPTTTAHWTYALWFRGEHPESGLPVSGSYGKVQINPRDNEENLAEGYIANNLEALTGEYRSRYLDGEYSNNSDLLVFRPSSVHGDIRADFLSWLDSIGKRRSDVRVTFGLDLGYDDSDAFCALAFVDGHEDVWLLDERKADRQTVTELGVMVKESVLAMVREFPSIDGSYDIWTDTGGGGKKTAAELEYVMKLPVRAAYKRNKEAGVRFLADDVREGRLHIKSGGPFHLECSMVVWKVDKESGRVTNVVDDDTYHPDMMDSILYPYRYLMKHGNTAMMGRNRFGGGVEARTGDEVMADIFETINRGIEAQVW